VFGRGPFVTGENVAYGLEASVRQLTGPVTGSLSYSLLRSRMATAGLEFPAASDRTHVLNATAMVRARPWLRLGGGFTAATGVPFTRVISSPEECQLEPGCDPGRLPWAAEPHQGRAPTHASLDLLADASTRFRGMEVGAYVQLRNALGRENATIYTGDASGCVAIDCGSAMLRNAYERGIPRLPVIGIRVRR
jgi:hypothetical protein